MTADSSYRFTVSGRVQGVGYRQAAMDKAIALRLRGWIRNRDDGCVEGCACGDPAALATFRAFLNDGPPAASVDAVEWAPATRCDELDFLIRR